MITTKNVQKSFGSLKAVDGISIEVQEDSTVGLIGPNGSGKSTLFNLITGFYSLDGGEIYFQGQRIDRLHPYEIAYLGLRRSFQVPRAAFNLSVMDNMLLAARSQIGENAIEGIVRLKSIISQRKNSLRKALDLLKMTELDRLANEPASHLSGGQRKLLTLARTMMAQPKAILLDEPVAGVNPTLANSLLEALEKFKKEYEVTFLIIEHNLAAISRISSKIIVMNAGQKLAEGTYEEIQQNEEVLEAYLTR